MRAVPKPHQPPHLLSFGISMFLYRKEKFYRSSISIREDINIPPIWATWSSFFGRKKRRFARMTGKKIDDDNDGCNDNYDDNYGNFDDDYDEND